MHKECLVCSGSKIDPLGLTTFATIMKGISVRFFKFKDIFADSRNLKILCCNIGNTFIQPNTTYNIYTYCGS